MGRPALPCSIPSTEPLLCVYSMLQMDGSCVEDMEHVDVDLIGRKS